MISNLIRSSIRYRWIVLLLFAVIGIWGWASFKELPIDAVPDITNIQVQVNTPVSAFSAEEIERTVTLPIEMAMNGIAGVSQVRSTTRYGLSQVTVVFEDGIDIYRARQLVSERLQNVSSQLPKNAQSSLGPVTSGLGEIYHYVLEAKAIKTGEERLAQLAEIRALQNWYVKPRLLTVKGVAEVNAIGGFERQYLIQPDPSKLKSFGLHFGEIEEAIGRSNQNAGGGYVEQSGNQLLIQGSGLFQSLDDIRDVPLKVLENGRAVLIRDIGTVAIGRDLRTGAGVYNGQEAVLGTVLMLLGENSRSVATAVDQKIKEIETSLPEGYKIETVYDRSDLVNATLGTVEHNLLLGAALVIIVLFALLGNLRAALITAIVIPLSLLITFIFMRYFRISGNLVSLGALDFGIIVDGAVIVLDNCVRHIHEKAKLLRRPLSRSEIHNAIHAGTVEIRTSAGFGELIIVVVFLPIFAFVGIEGKMFIPMAATFIFAILGAVVMSFTLVPALASLLLNSDVEDREPVLMSVIHRRYTPILTYGLRFKRLVVAIAVVIMALATFLFMRLGGEFLPQLNEGSIAIQFLRPATTGITKSTDEEKRSHEVIKKFPEVRHVFSRIGTSEIATDPMGPNLSDVYIMLKNKDEWPIIDGRKRTSEELIIAMNAALKQAIPDQEALFSQPIQLRFNELMEGTRADVTLKVFGTNQNEIDQIAEKIVSVLSKIPGAGDVELESTGTQKVIDVVPRKDVLRKLGASSNEVLETVDIGIGGKEVGWFYEGVRRFPIVIRLTDSERRDANTINALPVAIAGATNVPLSKVATIQERDVTSVYTREQAKRRAAVLINPRGRDTQSFVREAQAAVAKDVPLPAGVYLEWGGNFKNLEDAKSRLLLLAPITLILVLLMIYAAFKNAIETALILACIPFALVGGVVALNLKGLPLSISAAVGFIALSGIAVLNGVVLVSYFNVLKKRGKSGDELVVEGTSLRLRPVLMTALVDIFGFLPMAFSKSMGAEVQEPLATVIIGGIASATILTLIVLPALYRSVEPRIFADNRSY